MKKKDWKKSPYYPTNKGRRCDCNICKRHRKARKIIKQLNVKDGKFIENTFNYLLDVESDLAWLSSRGFHRYETFEEGSGI